MITTDSVLVAQLARALQLALAVAALMPTFQLAHLVAV